MELGVSSKQGCGLKKLLGVQRFPTMKSWVPSTWAYTKKVSFSSHQKAKVGCLWHPGISRAQPRLSKKTKIIFGTWLLLLPTFDDSYS